MIQKRPLETQTEVPAGAWKIVFLLCLVGCLNYLDRTMITTMRTSIVEAMPMTDAQFGLLTSVFLWCYGLLSPFAGYLADHFQRSKVIIVSLFIWSAVTWATAHVTTFEQLLATRVLMGVSEACYIPAALALIMDYHKNSTRSLATGLHIAGIMAGQSLGFVGGWMAEQHQWSTPFSIFGIIGIVYSCILIVSLKDFPKNQHVEEKSTESKVDFAAAIKSLFSQRSFWLLIIFWSILGIISWMVVGWMPTFYKEKFSLSQGVAGLYATGYFYPASIAGVILGGYLSDRLSSRSNSARFIIPAIGLCIAAPSIFIASNTSILALAIVMFMSYGLSRMFSDPNIMPILCLIADERYRATGYGVLNLFSCVIGGIGLYAGGVLRDMNIDLGIIFQMASLFMLVGVGLLYLIKRDVAAKNVESVN